MIQRTRDFFALLPDRRKDSPNRTDKVVDALLSAFSVFFLQCDSFLNYQRTMQKAKERNNAQSLFGVHEIPSDNQIRNILETISYQEITPLIADLGEDLYRRGALDSWRTPFGTFLGVLDGTTTISSDTISCSSCTHVKGKDGSVLHRHSVVTPILVSPGEGRVVALPPEFVTPQDGHAKQDCEIAATSRWLMTWGARYAPWKLTLLGDDFYAHQPFCRKLLSSGFDFLFVCKPSSHKILYEDIEGLAKTGALATIVHKRVEGVRKIRHFTDTYRFMNDVPIKDGADALKVNWLELVTTDGIFRLDGGEWEVTNNVWLVGDEREVVVVDAAHDARAIAEAVHGRRVRAIALTHGHNDHINAAVTLQELVDAPILLHPDDTMLWLDVYPDRHPDRPLEDGMVLKTDGVALQVLHTPGHSPGCCCFVHEFGGHVFSGDTLFCGGPGATGRSYSDFPTIVRSIRERLLTLPPETVVHTGHGQTTTIGREAPDLEEWVRRGY